mmetsp:Transcript_8616/g.35911  ORF Transcript_8616/g.35911 Transcript_8616/m.35911 type:complete len:284 (+) Transcript_8616:2-853(+)
MDWAALGLQLVHATVLFMLLIDPKSNMQIHECKEVALDLRSGDLCWTWIDDLRPSQFAIGAFEVHENMKTLEAYSRQELRAKKRRAPVPINIAPGGYLYMYNKHHTVRSMWDSKKIPAEDKWVYATVDHNWSYLQSLTAFYRALVNRKLVWLTDHKGVQPMDPSLLPRHVKDLQNDPFRSLAAITKVYGCWSTSAANIPFVEFIWADHFRRHLSGQFSLFAVQRADTQKWCAIRPYSPVCIYDEAKLLSSLLDHALKFCDTPDALELPGAIERDGPFVPDHVP